MTDSMGEGEMARRLAIIEIELRVLRRRLAALETTLPGTKGSEDLSTEITEGEAPKPAEMPPPLPPAIEKNPPPLKEARSAFESSLTSKVHEFLKESVAEPEAEARDEAGASAAEPRPEEPGPLRRSVPSSPRPSEWRDFADTAARKPAIDWHEILLRLKILPPPNEGNVEIQLGAWWATRIGILLAVIGAVFFGIYVSRNTPPWIKFGELCLAGIAVTGLGLWLERKVPKFGVVVFAGGLALDYFAVFAGYALPATEVIKNPIIADALQILVIAVMVACAECRRSQEIASIAVFLGFVTCFFSVHVNLNDFALIASGLLGAAAVWFYLKNAWYSPYQLAVPLAYVVYAVVALYSWAPPKSPYLLAPTLHRPLPSFAIALSYPLVYMILFAVADYGALVRNQLMPQRPRRLVQICNTTGAILLGYVVTKTYFADQLYQFYFVFGGVLIGAAVAYYLTRPSDIFASIYFAKGSALITLGIIARYRAQTRWMALLIESFVLLLSAKRSRRIITEVAMLTVWVISADYYTRDSQSAVNNTAEVLLSLQFWMAFGYVLASAAVLALYGRWFGLSEDLKNNLGTFWGKGKEWISPRTVFSLAFCVLILGPYICVDMADAHEITGYPTATFAMVIVGLCLVAGFTRSWIPLLAAVFPFVLLHERVWVLPSQPQGLLWTNGAIAIGLTWALLVALFALPRRKPNAQDNPVFTAIGLALHIIWILTLSTLYIKTCSVSVLLCVSTATSILLMFASSVLPAFALAEVSVLPMITAASVGMNSMNIAYPVAAPVSYSATIEHVLLWISAIAAFAYAVCFAAIADLRDRLSDFGKLAGPWVHTFVAAWITLVAMGMCFDNIGFVMTIESAAILVVLFYRWPGLRPALFAGLLFTAVAHLAYWSDLLSLPQSVVGRSGLFLWVPIASAILTAGFVPLTRWLVPDMNPLLRKMVTWSHGILALLMLYLAFLLRTGSMAHYVTVFWGLAATALLIGGLSLRIKPFRIIAMAGLALCIPRVFLVDTRSTFYRIIAFFVMGLALLAIGLLYNKYRTVIENWEKESA